MNVACKQAAVELSVLCKEEYKLPGRMLMKNCGMCLRDLSKVHLQVK